MTTENEKWVGTGWNYRVIVDRSGDAPSWAIHEVYYDKDGKPVLHTESPIAIYADEEGEPMGGLRAEIEYIAHALDRPVLRWDGDKLVEDDAD